MSPFLSHPITSGSYQKVTLPPTHPSHPSKPKRFTNTGRLGAGLPEGSRARLCSHTSLALKPRGARCQDHGSTGPRSTAVTVRRGGQEVCVPPRLLLARLSRSTLLQRCRSSHQQPLGLTKGQAADVPPVSPAQVDLRPNCASNAGFDTSLFSNTAFHRRSLVALYEIISI